MRTEETLPPHVNPAIVGVDEKFGDLGDERPHRGETEGGEDDDDDPEKPEGVAEDKVAHGRLVDVPVEVPHRPVNDAGQQGGEDHEHQGRDQFRYPSRDLPEIKGLRGLTVDSICDLFRCGEEKSDPEDSDVE